MREALLVVNCRTPNASAVEKVPITRREADVANFMAMRMLALCASFAQQYRFTHS